MEVLTMDLTMPLVNEPFRAGRRAIPRLLAVVTWSLTAAAQNPQYLDLTLPHTRSAYNSGGAGGQLGSWSPPAPPLEVTIQDIYPAAISPSERVKVVLLLRNTSAAPVDIPASSNYAAIIKPGNRSQREFRFKLLVTAAGAKDWLQPMLVGTSVGSASVAGSFVTLTPNGTMVVRGEASAVYTPEWRSRGLGESSNIVVRAAVDELHYDDNTYFMRATSKEAVSTNTVQLFWRWR